MLRSSTPWPLILLVSSSGSDEEFVELQATLVLLSQKAGSRTGEGAVRAGGLTCFAFAPGSQGHTNHTATPFLWQ